MSNPLKELNRYGQSAWMDYITRSMIESGELDRLIDEDAITGMTSNPSIFHKAMVKSGDYQEALERLAKAGLSTGEIYETLAAEDIQAAADRLRPVYDASRGYDGFISLEVSPDLAYNTKETIKEAKRLWEKVNRPNLLIKVPGTSEGIPAIEHLLTEGVNVNITLLFSHDYYAQVRAAYLKALENRLKAGKPIDRISSVASFFLSRIDTYVDKELEKLGTDEAKRLLGKTAVAYAKIAYQDYLRDFHTERFEKFQREGAKTQRPLWASTSTKNPNYHDLLYVEPLIGKDVINTLPPHTVDAFRDHGKAANTVEEDFHNAYETIQAVEKLGISMEEVTDKLQKDGVQAFIDSWNQIMEGLDQKRKELVKT